MHIKDAEISIRLEMGKVVSGPEPNFVLTGTGSKIFFWTGPGPEPKTNGPAHV
jgi:hypothetical protein